MEQKLREYARLVIEMGLNLQKGQTLCLRAPVECAAFARLCAEAAYDAGCREVMVDYLDSDLLRQKYLRAEDGVFDICPQWYADKMNGLAAGEAAFLTIHADDPDALRGVDPGRIRRTQQANGRALLPYQSATMSNRVRWCVVATPISPWAEKVFPGAEDPISSLWDAIFTTLRITGDGKAVQRWRDHAAQLEARSHALTALKLDTLHYRNSLGTDLTIGLSDKAVWSGGADRDQHGVSFIANMPTEEIFTVPERTRVQGRVVSSMPFVLHGNVIERFAFTFQEGRIVGIEAETEADKARLLNAITVDEGASYLGEVALVPYDSPISNLGILFYNTLFDENASCHLAFGKGYPCLEGAESMDGDALLAAGVNDSFTHMDFMIGTRDLSITGATREGKTVAIFENGNFAL